MPSRRCLLATLGAAATAGTGGCVGWIRSASDSERAVEGPCDDPTSTWPTAGGDRRRTGRTDTAPPTPEAGIVDLLAATREDGQRRLASSLPAVADGTAYVPSGSELIAVDLDAPADGPTWVHELDDSIANDAIPTLACSVVLVPGLDRLAALDSTTGEAYWQADAEGYYHQTTIASVDETIYVAGGNLVAVDVRTGELQRSLGDGHTVALGDGGVYTTMDGNGSAGVFAYDQDGTEQWHLSPGKIVGSASVYNGTVWVADENGTVYALDAATGETLWSRSPDGVGKIPSGLAVGGDDVVVPAGEGETSVVLDAATGETRWTADTGLVTGRPVVGDDWVALGRTNAGVTVYDRVTGDERATWSRGEYNLGTIDGLAAVEDGIVVHEFTPSPGLSLIR